MQASNVRRTDLSRTQKYKGDDEMRSRGTVQRDTSVGEGVISVNGKQYSFSLVGTWHSEQPPRTGMAVDVDFDASGNIMSVTAVTDSQVAREQAEQALAGVKRHGASLGTTLKGRFGIGPIIAEILALLGFFVMPVLGIGAMGLGKSFTGWDVTGFNAATMSDNDHGILSLVALIGMFAPLAGPFLSTPWRRWLNGGPWLVLLLTAASLLFASGKMMHEASEFGAGAGSEMAQGVLSMISPQFGLWVWLGASLYLAYKSVRPGTPAA